jgi:hypothetical protein
VASTIVLIILPRLYRPSTKLLIIRIDVFVIGANLSNKRNLCNSGCGFRTNEQQRIRPFKLLGFVADIDTAIGPENDSPKRTYGSLFGRDSLTRLSISLYPSGSLTEYGIVLTGTVLQSACIKGSNNLHVPSNPGSNTSVSIAL